MENRGNYGKIQQNRVEEDKKISEVYVEGKKRSLYNKNIKLYKKRHNKEHRKRKTVG